ncbi:zf-RING_2 domain-containing protein [Cephalotus follicularis]|uniref:RING-type E3 ubiquitin transferase n=1 Tax=Cephalotus follicularis TaxID=3775 RepID=A0A1Q3DI34_CEPFO|nr:zf-RING_2 domain-containing protein [Cephalotus follicularis]
MSSTANPNPWSSSATYKDCSQGICSIYCPQWCYIVFPPPPPFRFGDESGTDFSPLIIAVLGILASVFIMVSYYTFISKYCRRRGHDNTNVDSNENRDETNNEARQGTTSGLDETLIKSITVYKYKKGDGLIEGTDCSVCLSEFEEDESLRLLPECNHAFHLPCIDTWLKSHPSCPLCRANISSINALPNQRAAPAQETQHDTNVSHVHVDPYRYRNDAVLVIQVLKIHVLSRFNVSFCRQYKGILISCLNGFRGQIRVPRSFSALIYRFYISRGAIVNFENSCFHSFQRFFL